MFEAWKYYFVFDSKIVYYYYIFFKLSFHNVVSALPNVVKIDGENGKFVSTLSDVVQINFETDNVCSTLFNAVNFKFDVHNVVSACIWRCVTSGSHINLQTTLKQWWNVCWEHTPIRHFQTKRILKYLKHFLVLCLQWMDLKLSLKISKTNVSYRYTRTWVMTGSHLCSKLLNL